MDVKSTNKSITIESFNEEEVPRLARVEAITDLLATVFAYYKLSPNASEKKHATKIMWSLVNNWLQQLGSVKYINGLVEELASRIKKKLWEIDDLSLDDLKELLILTYIVKEAGPETYSSNELERYSRAIRSFLEKLGYVGDSVLIENILDSTDPEKLVSLATLTVVLATNY